MQKICKLLVFFCLSFSFLSVGYSWEDHPDKQDHEETDRLFALIQKQTGAEAYERMVLEKESEDALKTHKDSKFKKKAKKNEDAD